MSPASSCFSFVTSRTTSPLRTVALVHLGSVIVEDTTYLGRLFNRSAHSPVRDAHRVANHSSLRRPSSSASVPSASSSQTFCHASRSFPPNCPNHPPSRNPSAPSGSCTTPSSETFVLMTIFPMVRSPLLRCSADGYADTPPPGTGRSPPNLGLMTATMPATSPSPDVARRLMDDGYVVVTGMLTPDGARHARADLDRVLRTTRTGRNSFEGFDTQRVYALFAKTRVFDGPATDPLLLGVLDQVLGHYQLSAPVGICIGPGEQAQILHRDDAVYPVPEPHPPLVVNTMWPLDAFTAANGATRFVAG